MGYWMLSWMWLSGIGPLNTCDAFSIQYKVGYQRIIYGPFPKPNHSAIDSQKWCLIGRLLESFWLDIILSADDIHKAIAGPFLGQRSVESAPIVP